MHRVSDVAQFFPQTHTKAVIDDNGYTAESRLQAMQDEISNLQEGVVVVGEGMTPVPSDLAPTENSTNWVTSGGVYNQLHVRTDETQILSVTPTENKVSTYADTISIGDRYTITFSDVSENSSATISVGDTSSASEIFIQGIITEGQTLNVTSTVNATHWRLWRPTGSSYKVTIVRKDVVMVKDALTNVDSSPTDGSSNLVTSGGVYNSVNRIDKQTYLSTKISTDSLSSINKYINSNLRWVVGSNANNSVILDIIPNATYKIHHDNYWNGLFLKTNSITNIPDLADGEEYKWRIGTHILTAPSDAKYLYFTKTTQGELRLPDIEIIEYNRKNISSYLESSLGLNLAFERSGYVSNVIGTKVSYTTSSATVSYPNIINVYKGYRYIISIDYGDTVSSDGERTCAVVDNDNIVRQTFNISTKVNSTITQVFEAEVDGALIISVDNKHTDISIKGCALANNISDIIRDVNSLKKGLLNKTFSVSAKTVYSFSDIRMKANHTYVCIITCGNVNTSNANITFGYANSSVSKEAKLHFIEGKDVVKFSIGSEDVIAHFYLYNGLSSSCEYSMRCEEWDEYATVHLSEPSAVIVAANNSKPNDKYIAEFICDGQNDEVELQKAIEKVSTTGGKVILTDGEYIIHNLKDSGNQEIGYIGLELAHPDTRHYIEISGMSKPIRVSEHEVKLGATIFVAASAVADIDDTTHITVIGALPLDNSLMRLARGINFELKNIGINIPGNTKAIRCVDAEFCSALHIENVCIGISSAQSVSTSPNPECIGIRGLGGWNYGVYYILRCIKVLGMGVAFDLGGEHLLMEQCAVRYSDVPYRFYKYGDISKMAHPNTMINCCEESCNKSFVFGSNPNKPGFSIIDYNIEWRPSEHNGNWDRTQKALEENPGDIRGNINFVANKESYTNVTDIDFWENGSGIGFLTKNDANPLRGTTANRPTHPYFGQIYYDTTAQKFVTYNGNDWV